MNGAVQPLHVELLMLKAFENLLDATILAHAGTHGWSQGRANSITSKDPVLFLWFIAPLRTVHFELRTDVDPNAERLEGLISNHI